MNKTPRPHLTVNPLVNKLQPTTPISKLGTVNGLANRHTSPKSTANSPRKFKIYKEVKLRNILKRSSLSSKLPLKIYMNPSQVKKYSLSVRFRNLNLDKDLIRSRKISKTHHTLSVFWKNISRKKHKLSSHRLKVSKSHQSYATRFFKNTSIDPTKHVTTPVLSQKKDINYTNLFPFNTNKVLRNLVAGLAQATSNIKDTNKPLILGTTSSFFSYTQYLTGWVCKKAHVGQSVKISYQYNSNVQVNYLPVAPLIPIKSPTPNLTNVNFIYSFLFENQFVQNFRQTSNLLKGKPNKVLSKAARHKMDETSSVTADRYRGNVYSTWGFSKNLLSSIWRKINVRSNLSYSNPTFKILQNTISKHKALRLHQWPPLLRKSRLNFRCYFVNFAQDMPLRPSQNLSWLLERVVSKKNPKPNSGSYDFKTRLLRILNLKFNNSVLFKKKVRNVNSVFKANFFKPNQRNGIAQRHRTSVLTKASFNLPLPQGQKQLLVNLKTKHLNKKHAMLLVNALEWKLTKKQKSFQTLIRLPKKRRLFVGKLSSQSNLSSYSLNPFNNIPFRAHTIAGGRSILSINAAWRGHNFFKTNCSYKTTYLYSNTNLLNIALNSPFASKILLLNAANPTLITSSFLPRLLSTKFLLPSSLITNLTPHPLFVKTLNKSVLSSFANKQFDEAVTPWYYHTLVRFIENCSGKKVLFQFYPFVNQSVSSEHRMRYKRWLPRMVFYERKLGHKFFLEEALHLIHLSFVLRDPKIFTSWLKAMILRISFWKTRSIFRFIKYLFHNYFQFVFKDLRIKGLKIKLKGKISAAGNSRKRTILYRIGKTSHSETKLRVLNESSIVNTFTGVMGLNIWLFY